MAATAEGNIHTVRMVEHSLLVPAVEANLPRRRQYKSYSVMLLLLDGSNAKSLATRIDSAMKRHGIQAGQPKF